MSDQTATLHLGENFTFVEDGSVDFVLTDPPFNISKKSNFHTYKKNTIHSYKFDEDSEENWDTYSHHEFLQKLDEWSAEWFRVLRKGGNFAIFCADSYLSHLMEALKHNKLSPRRVITWRKNNAVPVNRAYMPMSANEYLIVGVKPGGRATFNADVPIIHQTIDDQLIEATIVADKVSTMTYSRVRSALLAKSTEQPATLFDTAITEAEKTTPPSGKEASFKKVSEVEGIVEEVLVSSIADIRKKVSAMYPENTEGERYLRACVPNAVQNPIKVGNRLHPTEKPVPLLQFLVALYSKPNDVVLDGFGGSGSTGEASLLLDRSTIIVERDEEFYKKLQHRLKKITEKVVEV